MEKVEKERLEEFKARDAKPAESRGGPVSFTGNPAPDSKAKDDPQARIERLKEEAAAYAAELERLQQQMAELQAEKGALPLPGGAKQHPSKDDPGDLFVNAYLTMVNSDKLEKAGKIQDALQQMQLAAGKFDEIKQRFPAWQPQIMEYRTKRVQEAVDRLQAKQSGK